MALAAGALPLPSRDVGLARSVKRVPASVQSAELLSRAFLTKFAGAITLESRPIALNTFRILTQSLNETDRYMEYLRTTDIALEMVHDLLNCTMLIVLSLRPRRLSIYIGHASGL